MGRTLPSCALLAAATRYEVEGENAVARSRAAVILTLQRVLAEKVQLGDIPPCIRLLCDASSRPTSLPAAIRFDIVRVLLPQCTKSLIESTN